MGSNKGSLFVVATPIGNLSDMTYRAVEVLKSVDLIAAEDTRHSRRLLQYYSVETPLIAFHQHNEMKTVGDLVKRLCSGNSVAIISDAGTPLINDPGLPLVRAARSKGIEVTTLPGPCALVAALSVSGLPTDRFAFEGFPPRASAARITFFSRLIKMPETLVFYEASHRIKPCLEDMKTVFPDDRQIVIARELTKTFETVISVRLENVLELFDDPYMGKGEFVILLQGRNIKDRADCLQEHEERLLTALLEEGLSLKCAVQVTVNVFGVRKKIAYDAALMRVAGQDGD